MDDTDRSHGLVAMPARVSGLHHTLVRALVRGEELDHVSAEFKAVIKLVLAS